MTSRLSALALPAFAAMLALLHHGHIAIFLSNVAEASRKRLGRARRYRIEMEPSYFRVHFGSQPEFYEVHVQRKTRAIDITLEFEGEREENQRWAEAISARAAQIQSRLGPRVELEQPTRRRTRLRESLPVEGAEWRPKISLTPELTRRVTDRLARFVEVLEPVLAKERAAR